MLYTDVICYPVMVIYTLFSVYSIWFKKVYKSTWWIRSEQLAQHSSRPTHTSQDGVDESAHSAGGGYSACRAQDWQRDHRPGFGVVPVAKPLPACLTGTFSWTDIHFCPQKELAECCESSVEDTRPTLSPKTSAVSAVAALGFPGKITFSGCKNKRTRH